VHEKRTARHTPSPLPTPAGGSGYPDSEGEHYTVRSNRSSQPWTKAGGVYALHTASRGVEDKTEELGGLRVELANLCASFVKATGFEGWGGTGRENALNTA
jgi:hypothetical protein